MQICRNWRNDLPLKGKNVPNYKGLKIYLILNIYMVTFFSVKGDAVKLLKHHLEILLQFVPGSAIFLIDWLDYNNN